MSVRLFVGNLAYDVTEAELVEFFSASGKPLSVRLLTDRETGKPRGFAFVEFSDAAQAEEAIRRFHQQVFKGRPLVVNEARPREEGAAPRPNAFAQGGRPGGPVPREGALRPDQPTRTFGPTLCREASANPGAPAREESGHPRAPCASSLGASFSLEVWTIPRTIRGRMMSPSGHARRRITQTRSEARASDLGPSKGRPPTPRARSKDKAPVGIVSIFILEALSPSFIIASFPKLFSI